MKTPHSYAMEEGGLWIRWTGGPISSRFLERTKGVYGVQIKGVQVHALAFDDPQRGSNFPRWDSYNGWTRRTEGIDGYARGRALAISQIRGIKLCLALGIQRKVIIGHFDTYYNAVASVRNQEVGEDVPLDTERLRRIWEIIDGLD